MNRRMRLLFGISTTVGVTLLLAWIAVQALIIRPSIRDRERIRTRQVLDAAERLRTGASKHDIEDSEGIDLRLFHGLPEGPPPGEGWTRHESEWGTTWKRPGGRYEIAAWTGHTWVVIHEDLPVASTLAVAFGVMGIPVVVLMFGLSQRAQRHQALAEATLARIASGDLDEELNEQAGSREVRRVAVAVNQMATQLRSAMEADRKRMAGLSHELRTPLTRIRLELELARREGGAEARLERVERDIEVFDTMLAEMLELSRLELGGQPVLQCTVVDLAGLMQWFVEEEGWSGVEIRGTGTATVDKRLVGRLVGNLLRNSAQHAPTARRWIEVSDDTLAVGDDGPGLPAGVHAQALQAFQRGDASDGHGLGLAIVAEIAALHGAALTLSEPPGLIVTVRFAPRETAAATT